MRERVAGSADVKPEGYFGFLFGDARHRSDQNHYDHPTGLKTAITRRTTPQRYHSSRNYYLVGILVDGFSLYGEGFNPSPGRTLRRGHHRNQVPSSQTDRCVFLYRFSAIGSSIALLLLATPLFATVLVSLGSLFAGVS